MDLKQRMAELDARNAARMSALNARMGLASSASAAPAAEPAAAPTPEPAVSAPRQVPPGPVRPAAPASMPRSSSASDPQASAAPVPERHSRGVRPGTFCALVGTLFLGLPTRAARRLRAGRGSDSSDSSGWYLSASLLFVCSVLGFVWNPSPVNLLSAVAFGVMAVPVEGLWPFQALDDGSCGRGRLRRYVIEGVFLGLLSAETFGCLLMPGEIFSSLGPCGRAVVEEAFKVVILLAVFLFASDHGPRENGLLAGAAFGAGFLAISAAQTVLLLAAAPAGTGFLAFARFLPFGHLAETAILGAALAGLLGFGPPMRKAMALFLLAFAIGMHVIWVSGSGSYAFVKYLLLDFAGWFVSFILLGHRLMFHPELMPIIEAEPRSGAQARSGDAAVGSFWGFVGFVIVTFISGFLLAAGGFVFNRMMAAQAGG